MRPAQREHSSPSASVRGRSALNRAAIGVPTERLASGRQIFVTVARRWMYGWELEIDGLGVTQSRTLRDAEAMIRDYIALDTGLPPDAFDVDLVLDLNGLETDVERAKAHLKKAEKAQREAAARSRAVVRRLKDVGLSGNDIATILGVSPQRVSQLAGRAHT